MLAMTSSKYERMYRTSITTAFIVTFLVVSGAAWATDWPQFRGPNADGISREKGINRSWQENPPEMLWKVSLTDEGYSGPSVAFGKVFIVDHKGITDIVRAIDIRTGTDVWRFEYEDSKKSKHGFARATPLISGNKVIACPGGANASVVALDKSTGQTIWKGGGSDTGGYSSPVKATINGIRQYVVFTGAHIMGLDPETGAILWQSPWGSSGGVNSPTPIAIGNTVYITSHGLGCALVEVSPDGSARERWRNKKLYAHFSSPIYFEDFVYSNSDPGYLVCLDPQTGDVRWKQSGFEKGPLVAVDGVLLAFDGAGGDLVMVKPTPEKYEELGRFKPLGEQSWTAPIVSGGKLIVRNSNSLACFALR